MKCRVVMELMQRHMDHDLNEEEQTAMEEHLEGCSECKKMYEKLELLQEELAQLPKVTPTFSIVDSILPTLDQLKEPDPVNDTAEPASHPHFIQRLRESVSLKVFGGIAAAGIVLALIVSNMLPSHDRTANDYNMAFDSSGSNEGGKSLNMRQESVMSEQKQDNIESDSSASYFSDNEPDSMPQSPPTILEHSNQSDLVIEMDDVLQEPMNADESESEVLQEDSHPSTIIITDPDEVSDHDTITDQHPANEKSDPQNDVMLQMSASEEGTEKSDEMASGFTMTGPTGGTQTLSSPDPVSYISPDGMYEAWVESTEEGITIVIYNADKSKVLDSGTIHVSSTAELDIWWKSNTQLAYTVNTADSSEEMILDIEEKN